MVNLKKYHRCDDPVKSLLLLGWSPTDGAGGGVNTVSASRSFVNTSPGSALEHGYNASYEGRVPSSRQRLPNGIQIGYLQQKTNASVKEIGCSNL